MKLTIRSWAAALILLMPLFVIQASGSQAAGNLTYSALSEITNKAINDARKSDVGEICKYGLYTSTTSFSFPPENYTGGEGDLWIYGELFDFSIYNWTFLYWDGTTWVDYSNDLWNAYNLNHDGMISGEQKTEKGLVCNVQNLTMTEVVGQEPKANHVGEIGDRFIKIDSKYPNAQLYYIWNGSKWVANLENPYTLAHAAAIKTKTGEYCIYGKNKDVFSSYYPVPPTSYKGVKGDLWIVAFKTTGREKDRHYWNGKSWIDQSASSSEALQKINDAAQFKARNSASGEVCYAGTVKSAQTFSASMPKNYKGKINDSWLVMDKKGEKNTIFYYWNGKSWVLN